MLTPRTVTSVCREDPAHQSGKPDDQVDPRKVVKSGSGLVALKGKMFDHFAEAVVQRRELIDEIKTDLTSATFVNALGS